MSVLAPTHVDVSIVIPTYNEALNAENTAEAIAAALEERSECWELIFVNDGSTDATAQVLEELSRKDHRVVAAGYTRNAGRGRALRTGFAKARGDIVVTLDADLSYEPQHIGQLLDALHDEPETDFVIGSPYMPGGRTENVPFVRLAASRIGNKILQTIVNQKLHTFTGILRAYRREVLFSLELEADGKEIHLEIISRALAAGYRVREVPAVLRSRKLGKSKFRFSGTAWSHLLFSFNERPMVLFGAVGLMLLLSGLLAGIYVAVLRFQGTLNPGRPLITLVVILMLGGLHLLSFGWLALQIGALRREILRVQREARLLRMSKETAQPNRRDAEPEPVDAA